MSQGCLMQPGLTSGELPRGEFAQGEEWETGLHLVWHVRARLRNVTGNTDGRAPDRFTRRPRRS